MIRDRSAKMALALLRFRLLGIPTIILSRSMANRVCIIDMPGLNGGIVESVPADRALGRWLVGKRPIGLTPSFPAVTCSVQATLTTGRPPA